jgi:ferredoxin
LETACPQAGFSVAKILPSARCRQAKLPENLTRNHRSLLVTEFFAENLNHRNAMAHVVTEKCNGCKFTDCVEVCPVACFYEMENQVVIHPDDCIDCMACVEVCPVHAIYADADVPTEFTKDIEFNAVQSVEIKDSGAPAITVKKDALPTADERRKALGY